MTGSSTAESITDDPADAPQRTRADRRSWRPTLPGGWIGWAMIVLAVVAVALLVLGILQYLSLRSHSDLDAQRKAATQSAADEVATLLTVSSKTSSQDLKQLQDGATGTFKQQLSTYATLFKQALTQGAVSSVGTIESAGLVSMNGSRSSASVAVAATATVKNKAVTKGEDRPYRLSVKVTRVHGTWLVSDLTFLLGQL